MPGKNVKIAIIGFGTIGTGVAKIILKNADHIYHKTSLKLELSHVVDIDVTRQRPVELPGGILHNSLDKVLADKEVEIAVELIGGTTIAYDVVTKLLSAGKHVVTANKALLAERGGEIYPIARKYNRCVAFEASCCGGIPIITALRTGLAANRIEAIYGIVNGTCNYILSEMFSQGKEYATALKEAQSAGFAESDPTLDVDGTDSAHKLAILAMLAFGRQINYPDIAVKGIDEVELADIEYGKEMGYVMKLLAIAEMTNERGDSEAISLRVHPAFISSEEPLAKVSGPFNGVSIFGDAVGHSLYYGRGAGMMPTASAVVADIIEVASGNSQRLFSATPGLGCEGRRGAICPIEEVRSRFYLRLFAVDKPGVFAQIARILGDKQISISACLQHESVRADSVPVVIMTHLARQGDMEQALLELNKLETIKAKPICIHVVTPPDDEA